MAGMHCSKSFEQRQLLLQQNCGRRESVAAARHDSAAQLPTPSSTPDRFTDFAAVASAPVGAVTEWMEIWDYAGGVRFRGFVAEKSEKKTMFVFFDSSVIGKDLKQGYVLFSLLSPFISITSCLVESCY